MLTILFVDDETQLTKLYHSGFKHKYNVLTANSGLEALEILKTTPVNILFTDINMPVMDGFELAQAVRDQYPEVKRVAISANFKTKEYLEIFQVYLEKPIVFKNIYEAIDEVTQK